MNTVYDDNFFNSLTSFIAAADNNKQTVKNAVKDKFCLIKNGAFLTNNTFTICFSSTKAAGSCSNTVAAFKKIISYDEKPIFCCLTTPTTNNLYLINTSFINKVSHSSKNLSKTKYTGSINFSDILQTPMALSNKPCNFTELFNKHLTRNKQTVINHIIENTSNIEPSKDKIMFSLKEVKDILSYPEREREFLTSLGYKNLYSIVKNRVKQINLEDKTSLTSILKEQEKVRGDGIEKLYTKGITDHSFIDYEYKINTYNVGIDIKSIMLNKSSNPKGYDITKLLTHISSNKNNIYLILFLGCDEISKQISTFYLASIFNDTLTGSIQTAWSGRDSRGTIQFDGLKLKTGLLSPTYDILAIDLELAKQKLTAFIGA